MDELDVVVVGSGIAGLVAARELHRRGRSVVVLEREPRTGGRIQTEHRGDAHLEHGGIFHTEGYRALRALLAEVGLADRVVAPPSAFHAAVRRHGRWHHVNYGTLTGPLRFSALGWRDRLSIGRAAIAALRARTPADLGDLAGFAQLDARSAADGMTSAAADYFAAGPHEFLWGVRSRDISYAMLALQLRVFKGELRELRGGMGQLIERLAAGLDVRTGVGVEHVEERDDGVAVHLNEDAGEPLRARAAVLACPAPATAAIWPQAPAPVRRHLEAMDYSRIDLLYLRTRRALRPTLRGKPLAMEVITTPEVRGGVVGGIYFADDWAQSGGLLLVTAAASARAAEIDDQALADRLQTEVQALHPEVAGQVTDRVVIRHHPYTPTFSPGSVRRLVDARRVLPAGRIDLAGDHMAAPWVEGAVRSGQMAAQRIRAAVGATSPTSPPVG